MCPYLLGIQAIWSWAVVGDGLWQNIAIPLLSWRAAMTEFCTVPLRKHPSRTIFFFFCPFFYQDVASSANGLLKGKPLQKFSSLLYSWETLLHFLLSPPHPPLREHTSKVLLFFSSAQPCSVPLRECLSKVFQFSPLRDLPARLFYSVPVNEDLHPRFFWERNYLGKKSRRVAASTRVRKDCLKQNR